MRRTSGSLLTLPYLSLFHIRGLTFSSSRRIRGGFILTDIVPKSPAGKILRRMLKDTKGTEVQVYEEKVRAKL